MFGYVKPRREELRVKDDTLYQAAYCGLCRTMGKCTGCISRLFLSYDMVLLLLTRVAAEGTEVTLRPRRCAVHPARPRLMMEPNGASRYSALATVLLAHGKAEDNAKDERGLRRLAARGIRRILAAALTRADCPEDLREAAESPLRRLEALEGARCPSVDECADTFGDTLAAVFAYGLDTSTGRICSAIGRSVGRVLYVLDAADDLERDRASGSFNPLLAAGDTLSPGMAEALATAVRMDLRDAVSALALLDFTRCRDVENILMNILTLGLPDQADRIFFPKKEEIPQ